MILLDASGVFAFLNESDPTRETIRRVLDADPGPLVLSPFVLTELDYLINRWVGFDPALDLLEDVASNAYKLAPFGSDDVASAREVVVRYRDLRVGLADASIVVLAGRYRTNRVLTLDERHFRALHTPAGEPFAVLPADA